MTSRSEVVHFDGVSIPFPDNSIDHILCTEVLEHATDPIALIRENAPRSQARRYAHRDGTLRGACVHYAPYDFHRFTRYRLAQLFAPLGAVEVQERGNDLAVIANKLIVVCMRLATLSPAALWRLPLLLLAAPAAFLSLGIAHLSLWLGGGSTDDPLGYGVQATKLQESQCRKS